jgi:hypothetical protein
MTPAEKAAASIDKGECDAQIDVIVNAMTRRVIAGAVGLRWRIDLDDLHATEEDLTLDEAFMLEKLLRATWGELDPLKSAEHAAGLIRVLLTSRCGMDDEAAAEQVKTYTVKQVLGSITRYSEVDPPKA